MPSDGKMEAGKIQRGRDCGLPSAEQAKQKPGPRQHPDRAEWVLRSLLGPFGLVLARAAPALTLSPIKDKGPPLGLGEVFPFFAERDETMTDRSQKRAKKRPATPRPNGVSPRDRIRVILAVSAMQSKLKVVGAETPFPPLPSPGAGAST